MAAPSHVNGEFSTRSNQTRGIRRKEEKGGGGGKEEIHARGRRKEEGRRRKVENLITRARAGGEGEKEEEEKKNSDFTSRSFRPLPPPPAFRMAALSPFRFKILSIDFFALSLFCMPSSLSSSEEMKKRDVSSLLPIRSRRGAGETKPPLSHTPEHGIQETSSNLAAAAARGGEGRRRAQPRRPSPKKFGAAINSLSLSVPNH